MSKRLIENLEKRAYRSLKKIHPQIIEGIERELDAGQTAAQIEARLRRIKGYSSSLTAVSAVIAAHHIEKQRKARGA